MSEKERPPSSKPLISLYILGLIVQLILIGDPEDPIWTFLLIGMIFIVAVSAIIIYRDIRGLENFVKAKGMVSPFRPRRWVIFTILVWIVTIPLYLYMKHRFLRSLKV
jgi:hypothetical protein